MKLDAEIKSIKNILANDEFFYQIPDYQRPYSWDKDNLSDLIDDLTTAYHDGDDDYFCGSLVLVGNKCDERFDIIDGQQRMTTFTIFACVIRDLYLNNLSGKSKKYISNSIKDEFEENKRKLKFLTSENYQIEFEETVLRKIDFGKNLKMGQRSNRYYENAIHIKELFQEKVKSLDVDVDKFVVWLYENVVLTVITCPSQDSAIQIFNVLNDRGMPLSSIDILKSSLMQKLSKEDRKAFRSVWESICADLNSSDVNLDLESMLTTYLYFKISANPKYRLDKELLAVFKSEGRTPTEIVNEIRSFSLSYIKLMNLKDKNIYCLRYLRHRIYWTSILTTAIHTNYYDIENLKEYLVAYYYQNWIAGATVARIKQTSYNILKLVKDNQPISSIVDEMASNLKRYGTTSSYEDMLVGSYVYGTNWDRAVLLLVEYFSTDDSKTNFISLGNKIQLEHILPRTPNEYWGALFDEEDVETWTDSLANLTLLSMRKNIQAQNYSFADKKAVYSDADNKISSFVITQNLMKYDKWTVDELEHREKYLVDRINEKLDVF